MKIIINTIKHKDQRYETVGDWSFEDADNTLYINVSDTANEDYSFLVGIHELIEAWLCRKRNITDDQVTAFDLSFKGEGEPGDSEDAPYNREHNFATVIERGLARELGVDWDDYDKAIYSL